MPPRKNSRKQPAAATGKQSSSSGSSQGSPASRQRLCDGCTDAIPATSDALKCSMCEVWLHRYCAGIPMSRYATIASSFVCSACSITASSSIVSELRSEIAALKVEVSELRTALNAANHKLELCVQTEDSAERQNAPATMDSTDHGGAALPQQGRSTRRSHGPPRLGTRPPRAHRAAPASIHRKPCIPVQGKRKMWGTRKTTTVEDVIRVINSNTSVKTGLTVKRKYKSRPGHPHTTSKWWFVISGEENILQQLQGEWSTVNNQTEGKWSLEPLLCYADPESTPIGSNCPAATTSTNVTTPPNPHQESEPTTTHMGSNATTCGSSDSNSSQWVGPDGPMGSLRSQCFSTPDAPDKDALKVLYYNARSIVYKIDDLSTNCLLY